ncbi:MAG: phosphotransferase [Halioglobus sp.]|nr:phosphotransferase [Halioglobus sp.]
MSPRPTPQDLLPWALSALEVAVADAPPGLSVVAGDASPRRYFRLELPGGSYVVVDAPPATEKNEAFVRVARLLAGAGVKVPAVLAVDFERGYLLLEDLGDQLLLPLLNAGSVDDLYSRAFAVLAQMAAVETTGAALGDYDLALLSEELGRFQAWFVQALLGYSPDAAEQAQLDRLVAKLVDSALQQPRVLVHRDFHSRNLMVVAGGELAVIDFQDAVIGPITYDLVSLLRDCYIEWPVQQVRDWALAYHALLSARGLAADIDPEQFLRWFDWMGLQRHLKVLGTFARLYLRDGKSAYLDDLPLVIHYVLEITAQYAHEEPAFAEFSGWFRRRLSPLVAQQPWGRAR